MVASLFSMLFKCVSSWQEGVSLWLVIRHYDSQKMFSLFTLVLESELSSVLETCIRAAQLLDLSIKKKKKQPKPIIRTGVTVPNVQKCVMVATLTLYTLFCMYLLSFKFHLKRRKSLYLSNNLQILP